MSRYKREIFYGIYNPSGKNVIEGNPITVLTKEGLYIKGILKVAGNFTVKIEKKCGEEFEILYDDIEDIL